MSLCLNIELKIKTLFLGKANTVMSKSIIAIEFFFFFKRLLINAYVGYL